METEGLLTKTELTTEDVLRATLRNAWRDFRKGGWTFAIALAVTTREVGRRRLATLLGEECVGCDRTRISRLVRLGELALELDEQRRERLFRIPPSNAAEILPVVKQDTDKALEIAERGVTQTRIRELVHAEYPDQHMEATAECRVTFACSANTRDDWQRALNVVRVHCGTQGSKYPSTDEIITCIAQTVLLAPELQVPDAYRLDVESGTAKCQTCGGYSQLERHHVVPRSHGGRDADGVERLVWLCAEHHREVTENVNGGWRDMIANYKEG